MLGVATWSDQGMHIGRFVEVLTTVILQHFETSYFLGGLAALLSEKGERAVYPRLCLPSFSPCNHADENLAVLRHISLNLLRQQKSSHVGIHARRLKAGWDNQYLLRILDGVN